MFEQLEQVERRLEEVTHRLCDPGVAGNPEDYRRLLQESSRLTPLVDTYRQYKKAEQGIREAKALLDESGLDEELRQLAEQELSESRERREALAEELKIRLLPRDPNDERGVIMEIRAGAGGEESALFAGSLYRMYTMYAAAKGYRTEVVGVNETELGGYREISFLVSGGGAYSRLKYESGVHRVQRVPETEAGGRIHTSTATVAVLPEAEEVEVDIDQKDLQIDTFRSSGAGGQHINKTESAIRSTCPPAWWWNARTNAASSKTGIKPCGSSGPGCSKASGRSSAPLSRPTAARRSGPATAASGSVPITFPRAG